MTEKLRLTSSGLAAAKRNFTAKYQPVKPVAAFPWDISVKWSDLLYHVESAISWAPEQTLLRFIHRYDDKGWFLTMECCSIAEDGRVAASGPRFDLRNQSILPSAGFSGSYDPAYFGGVSYNGNSLVVGMHLNYVAFSWTQELKEAATATERLPADQVNIVFSSISLDFGYDTAMVNVRWPHTIAFYFSGTAVDWPDQAAYSNSNPLVKAKTYGYADRCPNNCSGVNSWPSFFAEAPPYLN